MRRGEWDQNGLTSAAVTCQLHEEKLSEKTKEMREGKNKNSIKDREPVLYLKYKYL